MLRRVIQRPRVSSDWSKSYGRCPVSPRIVLSQCSFWNRTTPNVPRSKSSSTARRASPRALNHQPGYSSLPVSDPCQGWDLVGRTTNRSVRYRETRRALPASVASSGRVRSRGLSHGKPQGLTLVMWLGQVHIRGGASTGWNGTRCRRPHTDQRSPMRTGFSVVLISR